MDVYLIFFKTGNAQMELEEWISNCKKLSIYQQYFTVGYIFTGANFCKTCFLLEGNLLYNIPQTNA